MGLSISVSSVFSAVSVASAIGIGACSPARVPAKAQTLEEVLAPAVVWDEARDAMGIVLAAHDGALVLPGSPALRCTFASTRGPMGSVAGVSIDCGGARLAATSKRDLLRLINDGELHRQMALTTASNVELLGAALGLAIDPEISPLRSENEFVFWLYDPVVSTNVPAVRVAFRVLSKGRLRGEAETASSNRMTIDVESFRDLGSQVDQLRQVSRVDTAGHDAAIKLVAWLRPTLDALKFSANERSYAGVKLGESLEQIRSHHLFTFRDDAHLVGRIYPDRYKSYVYESRPTFLFVGLLDGKVRSIRALLDSRPEIDPSSVPYACLKVWDETVQALGVSGEEVTITAGASVCSLSIQRGNAGITLKIVDPLGNVPEIQMHGKDDIFDTLTRDAERRVQRQGFLDACNACTGMRAEPNPSTPGQHIVEIDRKLCIQKVRNFVFREGQIVPDPRTQAVEMGCNQHLSGRLPRVSRDE